MHNRMRVVTASFLVKNLLLPWQWGLKHFWDALVDADLECDALGWQYCAGCLADAHPLDYMIDHSVESKRFDPDGQYVRRWLPVLARLPRQYIHQPWMAPVHVLEEAGVELGINYPHPCIGVSESTNLLLAAKGVVDAALVALRMPQRGPYRPPSLNPLDPAAPVALRAMYGKFQQQLSQQAETCASVQRPVRSAAVESLGDGACEEVASNFEQGAQAHTTRSLAALEPASEQDNSSGQQASTKQPALLHHHHPPPHLQVLANNQGGSNLPSSGADGTGTWQQSGAQHLAPTTLQRSENTAQQQGPLGCSNGTPATGQGVSDFPGSSHYAGHPSSEQQARHPALGPSGLPSVSRPATMTHVGAGGGIGSGGGVASCEGVQQRTGGVLGPRTWSGVTASTQDGPLAPLKSQHGAGEAPWQVGLAAVFAAGLEAGAGGKGRVGGVAAGMLVGPTVQVGAPSQSAEEVGDEPEPKRWRVVEAERGSS